MGCGLTKPDKDESGQAGNSRKGPKNRGQIVTPTQRTSASNPRRLGKKQITFGHKP